MFKRILGAGLGWSLGGPIGGIIGWWLGGKLENRGNQIRNGQFRNQEHTQTTHDDFIFSVLILSSYVMKADRRITVKEVEYIKEFLLKHYSMDEVKEMMQFLKDIEKRQFDLEEVCLQIDQLMKQEEKYQLLHFLFGISQADGHVHQQEVELITKIAVIIRVHSGMFQSIKSQYIQESDPLTQSYQILGLTPQSSNEEIKKAFREMSLKNHPDRVAHLGKEVHGTAEEKFKVINQAYTTIKKDRGF